MSEAFVFICARETAPLHVPPFAVNEAEYRRNVKNAFQAIGTGFRRVGDLVLRPLSTSFEDHLLCDGSEVPKASFPQLFAYLGTSQGAATDPDSFKLPDYLSGFTFASSAPAQTVTEGGSVIIGTPTPTPTPSGGQTGGSGQNTPSGGRPRNPFEAVP